MNRLNALIGAAKAAVEPHKRYWKKCRIAGDDTALYHYYKVANSPATILELCALLEKAEEALNIAAIHCNGAPWVVVHKALAAIKQWKGT